MLPHVRTRFPWTGIVTYLVGVPSTSREPISEQLDSQDQGMKVQARRKDSTPECLPVEHLLVEPHGCNLQCFH